MYILYACMHIHKHAYIHIHIYIYIYIGTCTGHIYVCTCAHTHTHTHTHGHTHTHTVTHTVTHSMYSNHGQLVIWFPILWGKLLSFQIITVTQKSGTHPLLVLLQQLLLLAGSNVITLGNQNILLTTVLL